MFSNFHVSVNTSNSGDKGKFSTDQFGSFNPYHFKGNKSYGNRRNEVKGNKKVEFKGSQLCTHCKGTNHTVDRCYFLIGFPSRIFNKRIQPNSFKNIYQ